MMRDLWNVLPDDRPITSICIVENPNKKPPGYQIVDRTYDQDTDADLWKEGFFGRKITRYLCHSKSSSPTIAIVDSLTVINDKDSPPEGFTAVTHTHDSEQKATKKRLLCYRSLPRDKATQAITDLIILGKSKRAPAGFTLAGDMNGQIICFKATAVPKESKSGLQSSASRYGSSNGNNSPARNSVVPVPASNSSSANHNLPYPVVVAATNAAPPPLYPMEELHSVTSAAPPLLPSRNMTLPKNMEFGRTWHGGSHYAAPNVSNGPLVMPRVTNKNPVQTNVLPTVLDGIQFELNPKISALKTLSSIVIPNLDQKTAEDVDAEYNYNFHLELQALRRVSSK